MLTPRVRLVSSRTRSLKRITAFGAIRRFGVFALVKLNPRNFRSHGRATALFCSFTLSLSFVAMNRVRLFNHSTLSPDSGTNGRSPEVSSSAFDAQPPDLQPVPLMDTDFAVHCPLVRHRMPQIRFLYIGSRLCSTLPSDPTSR